MKKIFAKELAALAVLALAFTGCNTAFDGTNANLSEKEAEYTDRSGATQTVNSTGDVTVTGTLNVTNKKNEMTVTVYSFSKINLESADAAIKFQRLTKNATNDAYYPTRGTELAKTRVKANENAGTTTITYEVDATGITEDRVAFFVDATKLKTKGGTPVLALDGNLKRGEESDSIVKYSGTAYDNATYYTGTTTFTISGMTTTPVSTGTGSENFRPSYSPISGFGDTWLQDSSNKYTGVIRLSTTATNKAKPGDTAAYEDGLAAKLNENVILQYREPGKREYSEKKLSFTYHTDASTAMATDPYTAHSYTADISGLTIGTQFRVILVKPEGVTVPDWYETIYGHKASYYYGTRAGARSQVTLSTATAPAVPATAGIFVLHATVPSYIVVTATQASSGTDATSTYVPTEYSKDAIKTAQASFFTSRISNYDNWFEVRTVAGVELDPAAAKDFIVVDSNNKKIDADVEVVLYSYNNSNTDSGKVNYVKITVKDVRYRNNVTASSTNLKVLVGSGTKIKENKTYPAQLTFGQWKDVADDDASGYVQIN